MQTSLQAPSPFSSPPPSKNVHHPLDRVKHTAEEISLARDHGPVAVPVELDRAPNHGRRANIQHVHLVEYSTAPSEEGAKGLVSSSSRLARFAHLTHLEFELIVMTLFVSTRG